MLKYVFIKKSMCFWRCFKTNTKKTWDRFFSLSHDMMCIANFDGYFEYVNPAFTTTLGWTDEELTSKPFSEFVHPDDKDATQEAVTTQTQGNPVLVFENRYVCKNGDYRWLSWNSIPSVEEGLIYAVARDVTEEKASRDKIERLNIELEKRSRDLEAINQELESFSYSVSHDLRAPLRSIDGFSQMLLEDYEQLLDEEGVDSLRRIRAASQRMASLIDDILKLSRITRLAIHRQPVDLSGIARQTAEELEAEEPKRRIEYAISPGIEANGDPQLLRIVIENLLGNAVKFTGKRKNAKVEFGMLEEDAGPPVYFVRDNGAGFSMEYAHKLFGVFQRLHRSSDFPGTGIGLATVQRIINRHRGRVWAEGREDRGSTFYFTTE